MKVFYAVVRIEIEDDADVNEVSENMEYAFEHPGIVSTEIVEVNDKR